MHPNQENEEKFIMGSTMFPLIIKKLVLTNLFIAAALLGFSNENPINDSLKRIIPNETSTDLQHQSASHQVPDSNKSVKTHASGPIDTQEEISAYINHHLEDSHDFGLWTNGKTGKHYGFPLLVMFFDQGFHCFSSSKFDHGHAVVEDKGNFYKLHHAKIYRTDALGTITEHDGHATNPKAFDVSITKNVFGLLLAASIVSLLFVSLAKNYAKSSIPVGIGRVLEPLVIFVRDEIAIRNIGEKKHKKYMGYLLTVFFFVWVLNLMGMTPFGFAVTNNIAVTTCFAMFTYLIVTFTANKEYWGHIFWMPGIPWPMKIVLAPIEVLGTLTKPFSLLIRLFANMTAGHFVVMSLIALTITLKAEFGAVTSTSISFVLTLFISTIEVLVAFLQAFIFTMLSSLFIGQATAEHEHAHGHDDGHKEGHH